MTDPSWDKIPILSASDEEDQENDRIGVLSHESSNGSARVSGPRRGADRAGQETTPEHDPSWDKIPILSASDEARSRE